MERQLKRQQRTVGAIVKIPLEDGYHTYGRILDYGVAFYDARTKEDLPPEEIVNKKILFRTGVYDDIITQGYWLKVSKAIPLEPELLKPQDWYSKDLLTGKIYIHKGGKQIPATKEEVKDIECLAAWDWASLEKRLNDHYDGKPNESNEFMLNGKISLARTQNCKIN